MGKDSKIQWCNHTYNCWWGCVKCDPGCENCYAESLASRFGYDIWGNKPRRLFGEKHWNEPRKWNTAARKANKKALVFCGSMCDVFERHPDPEYNELVLDVERQKLWDLIEKTPWLIWLLLTKRPENMIEMAPWDEWPENVWAGVSVSEPVGVLRIGRLLKVPAVLHFLSVEPMLDALSIPIRQHRLGKFPEECDHQGVFGRCLNPNHWGKLDWCIIGGESEQRGKARPFPIDGAIDLVAQCDYAHIPVFIKQMGTVWAKENGRYQLGDRKGTNIEYWPEVCRRREFPKVLSEQKD